MNRRIVATVDNNSRDRPKPHGRPATIHELLNRSAATFADAPAVLAPNRPVLTYRTLGDQLARAGEAIQSMGLGRESRIGAALSNGPECVVALLAIASCAACAPLDPELDEESLIRLLRLMQIDALVVEAETESNATRAARHAKVPVVELRSARNSAAGTFELFGSRLRDDVATAPPQADDIMVLAHTSGTTSAPKIVPLNHGRIVHAAYSRAELGALTSLDRSLLLLPGSNVSGLRRMVLPLLAVGGSVLCTTDFDPSRAIDRMAHYDVTHFMASVATHAAILEELETRPLTPLPSLRFALSGGASLPTSVQERLQKVLGVPVLQGYGMTETGNIAQQPLPPSCAPAGSVGRPAFVDVAVVDDAGRPRGRNELGEILVRGPEVFEGYESDPDANAAAFVDDWFRTGDLGHIDEQGFLFVVGRIKDIINRGGAKVVPVEVEEALLKHPDVVQAAAFGVPHRTLGEDVAAAVVCRPGSVTTESDLRSFAVRNLARFKVPTRILELRELPRGSFDKVNRKDLVHILHDRLTSDFLLPDDPLERCIAGVFAEVLRLECVGAKDSFFELGGDSLSAMRVVSRLADLSSEIPLHVLFECPTPSSLASSIRESRASAPSSRSAPLADSRESGASSS